MSLPNGALFGIAWQLDILDADKNTILSVSDDGSYKYEQVEIQFNTEQTVNTDEYGFWYAEISIFNLNDASTLKTILFGQQVKLQAGWRGQGNGAPYGTIFEGVVYQPLWERIDGINYKLTLRCVTGLGSNFNNFVTQSIPAGWNQRQVMATMAKGVLGSNIDIDQTLQSKMVAQSRGEVIFGRPSEYMANIAEELQGNFWIDNLTYRIANIRQAQDGVPTFQYDAQHGLIGTPQQTQDGVTMSVLLDPRLIPAAQVQLLPGTVLNLATRELTGYPNIIDETGKYGIMSVTHIGDSRGNVWQSDIVCTTYAESIMSLLNNPDVPLVPNE